MAVLPRAPVISSLRNSNCLVFKMGKVPCFANSATWVRSKTRNWLDNTWQQSYQFQVQSSVEVCCICSRCKWPDDPFLFQFSCHLCAVLVMVFYNAWIHIFFSNLWTSVVYGMVKLKVNFSTVLPEFSGDTGMTVANSNNQYLFALLFVSVRLQTVYTEDAIKFITEQIAKCRNTLISV